MADPCVHTHRSGRAAPRFIQDVLDGSLREMLSSDGYQLLLPQCHQLRQEFAHLRLSNSSGDQHEHHLLVKPAQTEDKGPRESSTVSCICVLCRYHFIFQINPRQQAASTSEKLHLLHHYVMTRMEHPAEDNADDGPAVKFYPLVARAAYQCSLCSHEVVVEVTSPRLHHRWIDLVTDEKRMKERFHAAKKEDPERFEGVKESLQTGALTTLNAYLRNLTASGANESKKILFRNKIYHLQFGAEAKPLFHYLEFGYGKTEDDEEMWVTPVLDPDTTTPIKSRRAFYEDVRAEIQSVMARCGDQLQQTSVLVESTQARPLLEILLDCADSKYCHSFGASTSDSAEHFTILGLPKESDPTLLQWAYDCQVRVNPEQKQLYLNALQGLYQSGSQPRRTEALETFLTTELSKQTSAATPPVQALRYFNLGDKCFETDDYIIGVYRTFVDQSPAQKHKHRLMLQQIGKDRNSSRILDVVYTEAMSLQEAYGLVNAEATYVESGIALMAQQELDNAKTDPRLILLALETISQSWAGRDAEGSAGGDRQEFDLLVADLRRKVAGGESTENEQEDTSRLDLPVGLENLRNTCYLNSILQYFFSVNSVRELALRCAEQAPLPSTQDGVVEVLRRLGLSNLRPGRAFLAYHFACELGLLFRDLLQSTNTCVRPRQRLANAALIRSFRVRSTPENTTDVNEYKSESVPPLPPRSVSSSAAPRVTVNPVSDSEETASDVSSQTLVNHPEDERSYVVVDRQIEQVDDVKPDVEMIEEVVAEPGDAVKSCGSDLTVEELAKELDQANIGSDQMDIDEVMGNMIDLLEAAEEVSQARDPTDAGTNSIRQSFFSSNIDHRKDRGVPWTSNKRSDRWAVAYPAAKGPRELYDALEPTFGLEHTDTDKLLYLTIETPAPNFHIYVQRTAMLAKNLNLVQIPETLYLDRYMEADVQSSLFARRKRAWNINARLSQTEEHVDTESTSAKSASIPDTSGLAVGGEDDMEWNMVDATEAAVIAQSCQQPSIAETKTEAGGSPLLFTTSTQTPNRATGGVESGSAEPGVNIKDERDRLLQERSDLFLSMQQQKYRLHAVICHVGTSGRAGHYWAWIYDFQQQIWRKYNDTSVSVEDTANVLRQLSTTNKGEPYYVAYVRESEIPALVAVPRRGAVDIQNATERGGTTSPPPPDVEMIEIRDAISVDGGGDTDMDHQR